ncbi:efflux RND transporter periplasmic adaptor subunit [Glaciecola sp. MF2-115]|uniref:efflux RND transporter periplasmic adaptor subunit n=1 Tax=Glaciecola sp. MF2-115 TaxID=3384827 RepID=UPI0039A13455
MPTSSRLLPIFVLALFFMVASTAHGQSRGERGQRKTEVLAEPLAFQAQEINLEAVGTAEAVKSVIIFPAVSERVTAVNFKPGQQVEKDQALLTLYNARELVAFERSKIQLKDASREYKRILESQKKGAAAENQVDAASTQLALAEVAVKEAEVALNERIVKAPFSGIVGFTDVQVGDRINQQTIITTIDDRDSLYINFSAPEVAVAVLGNDPEVTLTPWQNRDINIDASIAQIDSRINEQDRTIRVRALLNNSEDKYRPGMSFRVKLTVKGQEYVAIPEAALLWGATGAYVWQMVDGAANRVDVQIQQRLRGTILVNGDFNRSAMLVVEGVQSLRQGQALEAINQKESIS